MFSHPRGAGTGVRSGSCGNRVFPNSLHGLLRDPASEGSWHRDPRRNRSRAVDERLNPEARRVRTGWRTNAASGRQGTQRGRAPNAPRQRALPRHRPPTGAPAPGAEDMLRLQRGSRSRTSEPQDCAPVLPAGGRQTTSSVTSSCRRRSRPTLCRSTPPVRGRTGQDRTGH